MPGKVDPGEGKKDDPSGKFYPTARSEDDPPGEKDDPGHLFYPPHMESGAAPHQPGNYHLLTALD